MSYTGVDASPVLAECNPFGISVVTEKKMYPVRACAHVYLSLFLSEFSAPQACVLFSVTAIKRASYREKDFLIERMGKMSLDFVLWDGDGSSLN